MKKHSIIIAQVGTGRYSNTAYVEGNQLPDLVGKKPKEKIVVDGQVVNFTKSNYSFEAVINKALSENPDKMNLILIATKDSYLGSLYNVLSNPSSTDDSSKDGLLVNTDDSCKDKTKENINIKTDIDGITDNDINDGGEKQISVPGIVKDKIFDGYEKGLSKNIYNHFPNIEDIPFGVNLAIIDYGIKDSELGKNFEIIQDVVNKVIRNEEGIQSEDGEEIEEGRQSEEVDIYFDISNGFRSFPFYIYALTNYLQKIEGNKGDKLSYHMYYGMFDSHDYELKPISEGDGKKDNVNVAPLVDLHVIDDLLQMINAVSEFQNCGSVKQILEILNIHPEWDIQIGETEEETLSYAFEQFDYGTNANNITYIDRGINLLIAMKHKENESQDSEKVEIKLLRMLLIDMANDFDARFSQPNDFPSEIQYPYKYSNLLVQLANWYFKTGRYGSAAILIQESVLTYLIERYPERIKKYLLKLKVSDKDENERKKLNDLMDDTDIKDESNLFLPKYRDPITRLLEKLENTDGEISEFRTRYTNIKTNIRNVMAHGLLDDKTDREYTEYKEKLEEQISYMSEKIKDAENFIKERFNNKDDVDDTSIKEILIKAEDADDGIINNLISDSDINDYEQKITKSKKESEIKDRLHKFNLENSVPMSVDNQNDKTSKNYNMLLEEVKQLKDICDNHNRRLTEEDKQKNWEKIESQENTLKLLFRCVDFWIRCEQHEIWPTRKLMPHYFANCIDDNKNDDNKKKGNQKNKGYRYLVKFIQKRYADIYDILDKYEGEC